MVTRLTGVMEHRSLDPMIPKLFVSQRPNRSQKMSTGIPIRCIAIQC
ncbi:unnamed protein product [Strongylus vulgaris]|uniref:Uncharacterized protein n=1 Tax=Strongylus vulgaris TaxID=40348 RepID=A0A3P7JRV8_STRVU|nr:unnamed protein product [Strongylus vulgaris]